MSYVNSRVISSGLSMIVTILLGIGGALGGCGFLGRILGWYREGNPVGFITAVMWAILVLFVLRKLTGPPRVWVKGAHDVIKAAASSPHPALGVAELEHHNPVP